MADHDIETDETSELIASNKVEGTAVYDDNDEKIGTIYNFMVDKRSGQVEYAVLSFGGMFGLGSDYYPIPWEKLSYSEEHGGYLAGIDKDMLQDAPRYSTSEAPRFDSTYGEQIYGFYGLDYTA